jgi:glutamine cyclotransferase
LRRVRYLLLLAVLLTIAATAPPACVLPAHPVAGDPDAPPRSLDCTGDCGYEIVRTFPHDRHAFTQGLTYRDGWLYESTGLNGRSSLRRVELETGIVQQQHNLAYQHFGEGLTILEGRIYQLTWRSGVAFVYDQESFELLRTFQYPGEGWGLTHDGEQLIMSDGSDRLRFLDPETFEATRSLSVRHPQDGPVQNLNELEYIHGEVWANVWMTDYLVRIDPETGVVTGRVDLRGLLSAAERLQGVDVLNGIAYDTEGDRLFVTGKLWPKLFQIRLVRGP